jgi:DNA-binding response OmpR family regulator
MTVPASPPHILVVEDDLDLRPVLAATIRMLLPCVVSTAPDGAQGLLMVAEIHPHCVIVDLKMPHLDGFQFIRALRGDPETAGIPIIILSALVQDFEKFDGWAAGADQYLNKPATPDELLAAIQFAVALSVADREARLQQMSESGQIPPSSYKKGRDTP